MKSAIKSFFYAAFCATMLSMAMAAEGAGVSGETLSTEGAQVPLPPLPYDESGDRAPRVVIGSDDRSFTPWAYPYSTVGQTEIGCTATMVGRMVAITAAHCVMRSLKTRR